MPQFRSKRSVEDADKVVPGEGRMLNGAGAGTNEYNDTDTDANGTTYLKANLGRVDQCQVTISVKDDAIGTADAAIGVSSARPATPDDFFEAAAFVPGTIIFTLEDGADGTEIGDDTALDGNNLEFQYDAKRT